MLLYGCEFFANCNSHDNRKLNLAYNNIVRYVFLKGRRDHISNSAHQIFGVRFDNLLKIRSLILFHKIINTGQPENLLSRIKFANEDYLTMVQDSSVTATVFLYTPQIFEIPYLRPQLVSYTFLLYSLNLFVCTVCSLLVILSTMVTLFLRSN